MYAIGYDIGSSSVKAAIVQLDSGKCMELVQVPENEMPITARQYGWAEQDPEMWWDYVCQATRKLLDRSGIDPGKIERMGIAYQMHGLVAVDITGTPVRDAIIWCDSRAVTIGKQALADLGPETCRKHLLNSPSNFTASKLKWVKDHEPEVYKRIHKLMLPGDYIAFKFSGEIQTTINGLSEGILWDFKTCSPTELLLNYYEIEHSMLPGLVETFADVAEVSSLGAKLSGLRKGTKISYRSGDQPNNALSLDVMRPGETAATGGTSGVVYAVTNNMEVKELTRVNSFAHVNYNPEHPVIGKLLNINGAGISYNWLKLMLGVSNYGLMNNLAKKAAPGSKGLIVFPFGNGAERMFDNKIVNAGMEGLNYNMHGKEHLVRATLEGVAFAFIYGMDILRSDGAGMEVLKTGNDNLFRSEIFARTVANVAGTPVMVFNTTGAVGAARACMISAGNRDQFSRAVSTNDHVVTYYPGEDNQPYMEAYDRWYKKLMNVLKTV